MAIDIGLVLVLRELKRNLRERHKPLENVRVRARDDRVPNCGAPCGLLPDGANAQRAITWMLAALDASLGTPIFVDVRQALLRQRNIRGM